MNENKEKEIEDKKEKLIMNENKEKEIEDKKEKLIMNENKEKEIEDKFDKFIVEYLTPNRPFLVSLCNSLVSDHRLSKDIEKYIHCDNEIVANEICYGQHIMDKQCIHKVNKVLNDIYDRIIEEAIPYNSSQIVKYNIFKKLSKEQLGLIINNLEKNGFRISKSDYRLWIRLKIKW